MASSGRSSGHRFQRAPPYLKLVLRQLPDDCVVDEALERARLASIYTHRNVHHRVAYVTLAPCPPESDLLGLCARLVSAAKCATVEKAPNQKIPRSVRPNPLVGAIATDPYYLEFLAGLNEDGTVKPLAVAPSPSSGAEPALQPPAIVAFLCEQQRQAQHPSSKKRSGGLLAGAPVAKAAADKAKKAKNKSKKIKNKHDAAAAAAAASNGIDVHDLPAALPTQTPAAPKPGRAKAARLKKALAAAASAAAAASPRPVLQIMKKSVVVETSVAASPPAFVASDSSGVPFAGAQQQQVASGMNAPPAGPRRRQRKPRREQEPRAPRGVVHPVPVPPASI